MNGRTNSSDVTIEEINYGALIPLEPATDLHIVRGDASAYLSWTDPVDKYANPGGELVAQYDHTAVVRKVNSAPTSPEDGELVLTTSQRDQYKDSMYQDTGLMNRTLYHYGIFPYTTFGVASDGITDDVLPSDGEPLYLKDIEFVTLGTVGTSGSTYPATTRYYMASAPTSTHLIFAGGQQSAEDNMGDSEYALCRLADGYNGVTLTKTSAGNLTDDIAEMVSASNGTHAIFMGGKLDPYYQPDRATAVHAYSDQLTVQRISSNTYIGGSYGGDSYPAMVSSTPYALCGGGGSSRSETDSVYYINQSLTLSKTTLQQARFSLGGATVGGNYIFAGGCWYAGIFKDSNQLVDAFNSSMTRIGSISNLTDAFDNAIPCMGGSIGDYAIFLSPYGNIEVDNAVTNQEVPVAEAYDQSLTLIDASTLMQISPDDAHGGSTYVQYNYAGLRFGKYVHFRYRTSKGITFARYDANLTASKIYLTDMVPDYPTVGLENSQTLGSLNLVGNENNQYALACFCASNYPYFDPNHNRMSVLSI